MGRRGHNSTTTAIIFFNIEYAFRNFSCLNKCWICQEKRKKAKNDSKSEALEKNIEPLAKRGNKVETIFYFRYF